MLLVFVDVNLKYLQLTGNDMLHKFATNAC